MKIPPNEIKRIINEFVTQIMQKLRVPDENWSISYTRSLHHPTSHLWFKQTDDSKWQYRNMSEAIKYAYLKDYIKTDIVQVPESLHPYSLPNLQSLLDKSSTGVVSNWTNPDNDWLLIYLAQREGIDLWMKDEGVDWEGDNKYLIYKVINYDSNYYIAVLNTQVNNGMWCNLYPVKTIQIPKGNPTIPIVITPFSRSKSLSFINWDKKPWSGVK
tara:strand:+ start:763 stop:1404 length:642 start_codon:yes stop_codon:yes gene_type:complete